MADSGTFRYLLVLATLISSWALLGAIGYLQNLRIPSPSAVYDAALAMNPDLFVQASATAFLIVIGFFSGLACAWTLAITALISRSGAAILGPITDVLRGVPPVCLIPFFILWFGFEPRGKVILIAINVALVIFPALVEHLRRIEPAHMEAWHSFGRSWRQFVLSEGVRASAAAMLPTYRFALSFGLMLAIISESMGATVGLGHVISVALNTFSLAAVVAASLMAALIAALFDLSFLLLFRFLFPWVRQPMTLHNTAFH